MVVLFERNAHNVKITELRRILENLKAQIQNSSGNGEGSLVFEVIDNPLVTEYLISLGINYVGCTEQRLESFERRNLVSGIFQTVSPMCMTKWSISERDFEGKSPEWSTKVTQWEEEIYHLAAMEYATMYKNVFAGNASESEQRLLDYYTRVISSDKHRREIKIDPSEEGIAERLIKLGLVMVTAHNNPETVTGMKMWEWMLLKYVVQFEEMKNAIRSEFHAKNTSMMNNMFKVVLLDEFGHRNAPVTEVVDIVKVRCSLKEFVDDFGGHISTAPFLQGLRRCLRYQKQSKFCYMWGIDNAVFTQSLGTDFMKKSILLLSVLLFTPVTPVSSWNLDTNGGQDTNFWLCSPHFTNDHISDLLRFLPKTEDVSPTGIVVMDDCHRRQTGSLDSLVCCSVM